MHCSSFKCFLKEFKRRVNIFCSYWTIAKISDYEALSGKFIIVPNVREKPPQSLLSGINDIKISFCQSPKKMKSTRGMKIFSEMIFLSTWEWSCPEREFSLLIHFYWWSFFLWYSYKTISSDLIEKLLMLPPLVLIWYLWMFLRDHLSEADSLNVDVTAQDERSFLPLIFDFSFNFFNVSSD